MAMSGVDVDPECKVAYDETLMGHMYRYVTFKIDDGKVRIDKVSNPAIKKNLAFICFFLIQKSAKIRTRSDFRQTTFVWLSNGLVSDDDRKPNVFVRFQTFLSV